MGQKDDVKTAIAMQNDWYVMDNFAGTSLEEALIQFISERLGGIWNLNMNVHLIRNEEVFKLNNFAGMVKDLCRTLFYCWKINKIFLPMVWNDFCITKFSLKPKGEHLVETDRWKGAFLKSITVEYGKDKILQKIQPHYRLIGLPFLLIIRKWTIYGVIPFRRDIAWK